MFIFARKFNISTRLYFLFISFLLIIFIIYFFLNLITTSMRNDMEKFHRLIDFSRELQINFKVQVQEWKNTLIRGYSEEEFKKYSERFFKLSSQIQSDLAKLEKEGEGIPSLKEQVHSLKEKHLDLENTYRNALRKYDKNDFRSVQIVDKAVKGIDREPTKKFDEIVLLIQTHSNQVLQADQNIFRGIMIGSGFFFFLCISIIAQVIIQSIKIPLSEISSNLENIAKGAGDLTSRIPVSSEDEISSLADNFNYFIEQVHTIVKIILDTAKSLTGTATEFSASASEMSSLANTYASNAEEIRATVDQVSSLVLKSSDNSFRQNEILVQLRENILGLDNIIKEAELKVHSSLTLSNRISENAASADYSLKSMNNSMEKITQSSLKITGIVGIINDISKQINLLSLNAAIEAARAGESGKGFAVVADEIAKLAEKTSNSIKQIDNLIKANKEEINLGSSSVESVTELLNKVIGGVGNISSEIKDLFELNKKQREISNFVSTEIESVKELANESKLATEEEKIAFKEILKSVSEINLTAQQNAASAESILTGSEQIEASSENLYVTVSAFKV